MSSNRTWLVGLCALLAISLTPGRALEAQVLIQRSRDDVPTISRLLPPGIERGQVVEMTIEGQRLEGLTNILGPQGVELVKVLAVEDKRAQVQLRVAAGATPGAFPLHVLCKAGLSNPRLVRIDDLPQFNEQEENGAFAQAAPIPVPVAINGGLTRADLDYYRFEASAGQQLVFDAEAYRLGSPLRPVLALFDGEGRQLASQVTRSPDIGPDARLAYTFAKDGTYVIRISDLTYQGADFSSYHLRIGAIRFATAMFPLGGQRGTKVAVVLEGGNLPEPVIEEVDLAGDLAWHRIRLDVSTAAGPVRGPALFAVGEHAEVVENEPNDGPQEAERIDVPVTINGRIGASGDRDCFRFHAAAGARLVVQVLAQQLGSPLDSVVTISDAAGSELASGDDRQAVVREPPVVRPLNPIPQVDDSLVEFTAPSDGDYVVAIEDLYAAGGPAYGYRLEVAPPQPDFELLVQPGLSTTGRDPRAAQQQAAQVVEEFAGAGTGSLSIDRGGSGVLVVRALRSGYNGPIDLAVENLPPGVQVVGAQIAGGQNETVLNFTADFEAPPGASFVRIIGSGRLDVTTITRIAQQPLIMSALPVNGVVEHDIGVVALGVSQQGAELAVKGALAAPLAQGGGAVLRVALKRREGYVGDVEVQLASVPTGLSAPAITIAADRSEGETNLSAGIDLVPGKHTCLLEGALKVEGRMEPIVAVFPVEFEVLPLVALELAAQQVDVAQGSQVLVEVRVRRNGPLAPPLELAVSSLPKGVSVAGLVIPPDVEQFSLVVEAGETALASPIRRLIQVKAKTTVGGRTLELPSMRFALKVTKALSY